MIVPVLNKELPACVSFHYTGAISVESGKIGQSPKIRLIRPGCASDLSFDGRSGSRSANDAFSKMLQLIDGDDAMMAYPNLMRVLVLACCAPVLGLCPDVWGQEDAYREVPPNVSGTGWMGRFFPSAQARKPQPRPPREGGAMGGLLVPLKSFSNALRGRSDSEPEVSEDRQLDAPRKPREPFQDSKPSEDGSEPTSEKSEYEARDSDQPAEVDIANASPKSNASNATRRSLSGDAFQKTALQTTSQRSVSQPNTVTTSPVVTYEATPKTEAIDRKGTTRRSSSVTRTASTQSPTTKPIATSGVTNADTLSKKESSTRTSPPEEASKGISASVVSSPRPVISNPPIKTANVGVPPVNAAQPDIKKSDSPIVASRSSVLPSSDFNLTNEERKSAALPGPNGLELQSPGVKLKLAGPSSIRVGQTVPYEITATNAGQVLLEGLLVRVSVPKDVRVGEITSTEGAFEIIQDDDGNAVAWELERLFAGASRTLRLVITTEQAEHFAMSLDWTASNPVAQMPITVQQPQLQLALEGPAEVDYGSPQTYRLRVRNPGNAEVPGVSVELAAEPYGSNQSDIGSIPAGGERVVEVELTFQKAGRLPVQAKATSQLANLESSSSIEVEVRQSSLQARWTGPLEFYQGNPAEYRLTVVNDGNIDALDTVCRIELPSNAELVRIPDGVTRTESRLRWDIPRLAKGESTEIALLLLMNQLGENVLVFESESRTGELVTTSITTDVDAIADLQLTVNDPVAPAPVGQTVTYEITVANRGKKSAEDIFVIAQFSDGIEPIRIEGHTGKLIPGQVLFDTIPTIAAGETIVLKIQAEASKPGMHRFRAAVRCQGTEDDILKEESTRYTALSTVGSDRR